MTSSIIQDYVPDEYEGEHLRHDMRESVGIAVGGETHQDYRPRLATTPEDATRRPLGGDQQSNRIGQLESDRQEGVNGPGALPQRNVDSVTPRATIGERYRTNLETPPSCDRKEVQEGNGGLAPDAIHWPLLEQGHGYAAKRCPTSNVTGQGPAPFLTPGPHRHKLVPTTRQG